MAIGALANVLAATAPDRALSLLVEHLESMEAQGYQSATTLTQAVVVAARLGNEPLTLRLARRAMPLLHWWANYPFMLGVFNLCALALARTRPDTAARFQGCARSIGRTIATQRSAETAPASTNTNSGFITELRQEATRRILLNLTKEQLAQRRAEGEAMDLHEAVTHAVAEIDTVLAGPEFGPPPRRLPIDPGHHG